MPLRHGLSGSPVWIGQLLPIYPFLMYQPSPCLRCPYPHPFSTRPGPLMTSILGGGKRGAFMWQRLNSFLPMLSNGAALGSRPLRENKPNYFLCRCNCGPQTPAANSDYYAGLSSWASWSSAIAISVSLTQRGRLIHLTNNWNNGLSSKIITIIRFCLL